MRNFAAICLVLFAGLSWGADKPSVLPPEVAVVSGEVLEVVEVDSYTYLRLKTREGELWAAVSKAPATKGSRVTIENVSMMSNFESKSLKRTFQKIAFGTLAGGNPGSSGLAGAVSAAPVAKPAAADSRVAKASGANARTVAEIAAKSAALKDKPVLVRGRIVKFNGGIMGKNWIHLRDGTGSAADASDDLLVTTAGQAAVGDVVTVSGVVRTDKDFGSGYSYKVLVEDATLQK